MKKGELTSTQITVFLISVAGFIVLFVFVSTLFGDTQDTYTDELCRLSVLTRGTVFDALQSSIPLKCSTKKICFTTSLFGKCTQFAGEKGVTRVRLSGSPQKQASTIEKISAEAMYGCWSTMGEGKIDVFGSNYEALGIKPSESTCVICSRLALADDIDKDTKPEDQVIPLIDLDNYLATQQVPGQSYTFLQAFTKDPSLKTYPEVGEASEVFKPVNDKQLASPDSRQLAFVFMQIRSTDIVESFKNQGKFATGATFVVPGASKAASAMLFTPAGAVATAVIGAADFALVASNSYVSRKAASGYCGKFVGPAGDAEAGCSLVQGIPYSIHDVNSLCMSIQGNP